MTKGTEQRLTAGEPSRCKQCRRVLPNQRTGRPREFCSQACRQWHWVGKQRAAELQLNEHELIVTKETLDQLHDELYVLACAVKDAERDLLAGHGKESARELRETLEWVLDAARPLRDRELPPD
ncbi:MAG: hypothetical protein F2681_05740 [Actinobacteria bacterium]|uniref:Unannotated protein n=1 Tax=freshwater metagenome TaxID=449393 RepID=A0A6J6R3V2_9ZZZZ|nr:hypothetical protein [Actinomycetota bacterium]MSW77449.1 hypothetical protein [Actinomycetota bacterium]MSX54647.1 hypothetical protein [Actinomycetota bacterium]MSX93509.1 hypothetical protein [Actinomycetota bacterium]MSZ82627.1 hypothetical protein [Actinomycetota bacterium]